jgi:hypothetical protein
MVEQTPKKEPLPLLGARTPRGSVPDVIGRRDANKEGRLHKGGQKEVEAADVNAVRRPRRYRSGFPGVSSAAISGDGAPLVGDNRQQEPGQYFRMGIKPEKRLPEPL